MRIAHESARSVALRMSWLLLSVAIAVAGCGGSDVTGPVPVAKLSTDKVSYERKPGPGLQRFDFGELVMTEQLEPVELPISSVLDQNTEIIIKWKLRWPSEAGKIRIVEVNFFESRNGVEVELAGALAWPKEENNLYHFESELSKTPIDFVGKCLFRLKAFVIPKDYDPSSGVLPKETIVVIGQGEVEIR